MINKIFDKLLQVYFWLLPILFLLSAFTTKAATMPSVEQDYQNFNVVRVDYKSHTVIVTDEAGEVEWSMSVGPRNWKKYKNKFRYGQHISVLPIGSFDRITEDHFVPFHIIIKGTEEWQKSYS